MARFGRSFVQAATQPQYAQGLFTAAAGLGGVPSRRREEEEERKRVGMLKSMGPVEQAEFLAQEAKTTEQLLAAQELGKQAKQQGALRSLQGLQAAQMAAETDEEKERIQNIMSRVAIQAGVDPASLVKTPSDPYKVVGNRVFDVRTGDFVGLPEVAESLDINTLQKIATPDSLIDYIKTKDVNVLKTMTDVETAQEDITSSLNATRGTIGVADKALAAYEEIWPITYKVGKEVPLTASKELEGYVTTLQSNLAFDRLQKMRDQSKTGGALGQVSNIELELLKGALAVLDPSSRSFKDQLIAVKQHYQDFERALLNQKPISNSYQIIDGNLLYEDSQGNILDLGKFGNE